MYQVIKHSSRLSDKAPNPEPDTQGALPSTDDCHVLATNL